MKSVIGEAFCQASSSRRPSTRIDPFGQRLSYIRVYSGTLKKDSTVQSPGARKGIKIGPLLSVQGEKTTPMDQAIAGEIVAV